MKNKPDDIRTWEDLPLFFQNLEKVKYQDKEEKLKPITIAIDFYKSSRVRPYAFNKSISRCIKIE